MGEKQKLGCKFKSSPPADNLKRKTDGSIFGSGRENEHLNAVKEELKKNAGPLNRD